MQEKGISKYRLGRDLKSLPIYIPSVTCHKNHQKNLQKKLLKNLLDILKRISYIRTYIYTDIWKESHRYIKPFLM